MIRHHLILGHPIKMEEKVYGVKDHLSGWVQHLLQWERHNLHQIMNLMEHFQLKDHQDRHLFQWEHHFSILQPTQLRWDYMEVQQEVVHAELVAIQVVGVHTIQTQTVLTTHLWKWVNLRTTTHHWKVHTVHQTMAQWKVTQNDSQTSKRKKMRKMKKISDYLYHLLNW